MQYTSYLRALVVGGAVVAAVGSATSTQQQQPTGYYPRPQQQQAQAQPQPAAQPPPEAQWQPPAPEPQWQQPQPPPQSQPPPQPQQQPQPQPEPPPAPTPAPPPTPAPAPAPSPAKDANSGTIPAKRTQWVCNATGWWQKCESQGYPCYAQSTMMLGFGTTEAAARVSAEMECNTAMSRLMSVNFAYRTSVSQRCKAGSCSPPNAK
jgi:hypothetical protein